MKIIPVFLHYDYGIKERGETLEYQGKGWSYVLKQLGAEVFPFWWDDFKEDKDKLQKALINFVSEIKPDVIFFTLIYDEFSFETLDYLKNICTTINWFWDDHWRFDNFTRYYAPHFTYCITTDKFAVIRYKKIGYTNVVLTKPASFEYEKDCDFEKIQYRYDISFVGMRNGYREWIIKQLEKRKICVEYFGTGWETGRLSYEQMAELFKVSRINLNISNSISYDIRYVFSNRRHFKEFIKSPKRVEQIKQRNFEIPAFGGFQLTNYIPSLEDYFLVGKEIAIYTTLDDLLIQIEFYLQNEDERRKIMINGYKRVVSEGPTYIERFKEIFSGMKI